MGGRLRGAQSSHGEEGLSWLCGLQGHTQGPDPRDRAVQVRQGAYEEDESLLSPRPRGRSPRGRKAAGRGGKQAVQRPRGHSRLREEKSLELTLAGFPRSRSQMMAGTPERDMGEGTVPPAQAKRPPRWAEQVSCFSLRLDTCTFIRICTFSTGPASFPGSATVPACVLETGDEAAEGDQRPGKAWNSSLPRNRMG